MLHLHTYKFSRGHNPCGLIENPFSSWNISLTWMLIAAWRLPILISSLLLAIESLCFQTSSLLKHPLSLSIFLTRAMPRMLLPPCLHLIPALIFFLHSFLLAPVFFTTVSQSSYDHLLQLPPCTCLRPRVILVSSATVSFLEAAYKRSLL